MTTTKSYSEKSRFFSLYKATLKNQLPFMIVVAIVFALMIPLVYFVSFHSRISSGAVIAGEDVARRIQSAFAYGVYVDDGQAGVVMFALIVLGIVAALMSNNHMHSKKMTDLYHSLPVRRPQLLTANLLASLTAVIGPFLAVYIFTFLCQIIPYGRYIAGFAPYYAFIGIDLLCCFTVTAVAYAFTTFIATNVGTTFDSFALTVVIGFLPMVMCAICLALWSSLTYGAQPDMGFIPLLSPFTFGFQRFTFMDSYNPKAVEFLYVAIAMLVWLAVGAALYFGAIACYNRRKSEIAEQTQSAGVLQTIAKCFGSFCGGAMFFAIFYDAGNIILWAVAILAGAVVIGFITEVILSRGLRSFVKNLKWLLGAGVLCLALVVVLDLDLTGYAARVPAADQVESVTVTYAGRFGQIAEVSNYYGGYNSDETLLTQPDSIGVVVESHRLAVEDQPPKNYENGSMEGYSSNYLVLRYKLKNGGSMTRSYYRTNNTAFATLSKLEDKDDFITARHPLFISLTPTVQNGYTTYYKVSGISLSNAYGKDTKAINLSAADTERLLDAARQDMLDEPLQDILYPQTAAVGYMQVRYSITDENSRLAQEYYPASGTNYATGTVILGRSYTRTLALLEELDLMKLITYTDPVDRVTFQSAYGWIGSGGKVIALTPDRTYGADRYSDYDKIELPIETSDSNEIGAVLALGRNQMLMNAQENYYGCDLALMTYYSDGVNVGSQLARKDELPKDIRDQLDSRYALDKPEPEAIMAEGIAVTFG